MNPYELMFIVDAQVEGDEAVDAFIERFGRMVVDGGGTVTGVDKWGKRRFAYEIEGKTEGYYVVMTFQAQSEIVDEMVRVMGISDDIVRHMVVRLDEAPPAKVAEADEPTTEAADGPAEAGEAPEQEAAADSAESASAEGDAQEPADQAEAAPAAEAQQSDA